MKVIFEWDDEKAKKNLKKHKIAFKTITAFQDPFIATMADPDHSDDEERYQYWTFLSGRLLVVMYTERVKRYG